MAPKPIEDIDFPDLSNKILELLRALWTFVCDLCIVLWSYVTQAFRAVWTYPPFETFRCEFTAALIDLKDYVVAHPITATAIFILAYIVVPVAFNTLRTFFLYRLGFRERGVLRGSYAANYQSTSYGGNVPRGSRFAHFQSQGARVGGGYRAVGSTGSPSWG